MLCFVAHGGNNFNGKYIFKGGNDSSPSKRFSGMNIAHETGEKPPLLP